jgi:hypothetical protein
MAMSDDEWISERQRQKDGVMGWATGRLEEANQGVSLV